MSQKEEQDYRFIVEHLREMIIFWAVLVLTFLLGIIGLLPEIEQPFNVYQEWLFIIYFALLFGMCFSILRVFNIYREIRDFALSGKLGQIPMEHAENRKTLFDIILDFSPCREFEMSIVGLSIIIFVSLYLAKIGR
jgi:hypothetical protein